MVFFNSVACRKRVQGARSGSDATSRDGKLRNIRKGTDKMLEMRKEREKQVGVQTVFLARVLRFRELGFFAAP